MPIITKNSTFFINFYTSIMKQHNSESLENSLCHNNVKDLFLVKIIPYLSIRVLETKVYLFFSKNKKSQNVISYLLVL